jgi:hypothetical protein
LSFAHFCERHGPSIISTLQAYPPEENNAPPLFSPVVAHSLPPIAGPSNSYPPGPTPATTVASSSCAACSMHLPKSIASALSRPLAPTLRTLDPTTGYSYITTRHPKSQTRYSVLRTSVVRALSSELIPSRTGPVLFGDTHYGYTIAYVFAIDDPGARGGKQEGRRWYAFLALFEGVTEATGSWPWITKGFEQMASGLKERAWMVKKENSDSRMDSHDVEQIGGMIVQSSSLEDRVPSHIRMTRGSFGHPEGFVRRPRFGNPGGIGSLTTATVKSLGELIGLDTVDVEIHSAMGWIMSGLLGPGKDVMAERPTSPNSDGECPAETDGR